MEIHAGEAVFGGRDYTGIDVHRTARTQSAAWGGGTQRRGARLTVADLDLRICA